MVTGLASVVVLVVNVQPGCGRTATSETVSRLGSWIASFVVLAVALSVGTWKVTTAISAPGSASGLSTDTCADAGAASRNIPANTEPRIAMRFTNCLSVQGERRRRR